MYIKLIRLFEAVLKIVKFLEMIAGVRYNVNSLDSLFIHGMGIIYR